MDILVKPILTEKATNESELRNSYTFIVSKDANKIQIKKAIEEAILDGEIPNEHDAAHEFMMKMKLT